MEVHLLLMSTTMAIKSRVHAGIDVIGHQFTVVTSKNSRRRQPMTTRVKSRDCGKKGISNGGILGKSPNLLTHCRLFCRMYSDPLNMI